MAFRRIFSRAVDTASSSPSLTSSAVVETLQAQAKNQTTSSLAPSAKDLALLGPRLLTRAVNLAFDTIPRRIDGLLGISASVNRFIDSVGIGVPHMATDGTGAAAHAAGAAGNMPADSMSEGLGLGTVRSFAGMFSYMTSRWALVCFTASLFLNRTQVYASTRRPLRLSARMRFAVRIIPIVLFVHQILNLLQAIKCQTSTNYSSLRYGKPGKNLSLDYASDGGFLYRLSSNLLFWQNDQRCCDAVNMTKKGKNTYGSLSLLWPVFQSLCVSHFVETLSCALQGMPVRTETGMSIFEHSLAFAEVETMISNSVGLGLFGLPKPNATQNTTINKDSASDAAILLSRSYILDRLNVPPEVLLIAFISCCNSLSSNILGVFGWQNRFRLVNTTVWGICFMAAFTWGFFNISEANTGLFRFPTVCIVGFIPHLLILIGIFICASIYSLAIVISAFALPPDLPRPASLKERLEMAHENLQGNVQIKGIQFDMHQDFYSALLKIGFTALTAASEAVFLNEGRSVEVRRFTWLEEDRLDEFETANKTNLAQQTSKSTGGVQIEDSSVDAFKRTDQWESGYAKERTIQGGKGDRKTVHSHIGPGGVGALQRSSRHYLMFTFLVGVFWLLVGWSAIGLDKTLDRIRVKRRPQWFRKFVGRGTKPSDDGAMDNSSFQKTLDFWLLSDTGVLELPDNDDVDVEAETKRRIKLEHDDDPHHLWSQKDEQTLNSRLYDWWKYGGWWGEKDESGSYAPTYDNDDTTSVVSTSTANTEDEWESESEGQRTPTQANLIRIEGPSPDLISGDLTSPWKFSQSAPSRSPTPSIDGGIDPLYLAKLLNPKDPDSRREALILASHLSSGKGEGVMTRSRFRRAQDSERAQILTSNRYGRAGQQAGNTSKADNSGRKPTPEEEAEILESLILSRRARFSALGDPASSQTKSPSTSSEWQTGASGLGSSGPQCVVCQGAPRTIIAWPCRCLCLCEECRVSLAMNNFGSCVTCRRDVGGFVRLYVP